MTMAPRIRKLALTAHVTSSVGWLGAVGGFLALAVAGVTSQDAQIVRAAYIAMHVITWFVIVPLSFAGFLTGVVQSLGTPWGLFRYHWVVAKLLLTVLATIILLLHTQPIGRVADVAMAATLSGSDLWRLRIQLVGDASAALFVLFVTTTLSVYKPWGMTSYGLRTQHERTAGWNAPAKRRPRLSGRHGLFGILALIGLLAFLHIAGVGFPGH
jgi:hypothetical protein